MLPRSNSNYVNSIVKNNIKGLIMRALILLALSYGVQTFSAKQSGRPRDNRISCGAIAPDPANSRFGRQDYWDSFYESNANFSWYAGWNDLAPFVNEFLEHKDRILIPGVGNDEMLVEMYDAGYEVLTAMDYAPEGIRRCREMLGETHGVNLVVADARNLTTVFQDEIFDGLFEKGTLDAIYLSGGDDKTVSGQHLVMAISELGRVVRKGGIWISIAAVVVDEIQSLFDRSDEWECIVRGGDLYITEDGFTSNNVDGSLMVWRKL